jgi:hypothetical protein
VKKTSIYLDDELDRALAQRAAEEGLSKAELIRRTLTGVVARPSRPKPAVAVFDSGAGVLSVDTDERLRREGFGR